MRLHFGGNMKVEKLVEIIGSDFYSGVPDSQLKALCNYRTPARATSSTP